MCEPTCCALEGRTFVYVLRNKRVYVEIISGQWSYASSRVADKFSNGENERFALWMCSL